MRFITDKRVAEVFFSLQRHFENQEYDITQYHWHPINMSTTRYVKQFPVKYCQALSKAVITETTLFNILIPSFAESNWYIVDFVEDLDNRKKMMIQWKDRLAEVEYSWKQLTHRIINDKVEFNKSFPDWLIDLYVNAEISLEVFCIMILMLDLKFKDNFLWEKTSLEDKTRAYMKIVKFNINKYKQIFMKIMKENGR